MPVAAATKGLKRICPSCGTRYYDMNKRPVVCPSCATEFTAELKVKARRGRAAAVEEEVNAPATASRKPVKEDAEEEVVEGDADTVSLDEVEKMEEGDEVDEDLEIDDDIDDLDDDLDDDVDDDDAEEEPEEEDKG